MEIFFFKNILKLYRGTNNFGRNCMYTNTHTHTHIYIYMCVCVCVCDTEMSISDSKLSSINFQIFDLFFL